MSIKIDKTVFWIGFSGFYFRLDPDLSLGVGSIFSTRAGLYDAHIEM